MPMFGFLANVRIPYVRVERAKYCPEAVEGSEPGVGWGKGLCEYEGFVKITPSVPLFMVAAVLGNAYAATT